MWHFDDENKPGFAKYTPGVYLGYTTCILAKIYHIDFELFGWFFRVKKPDVFLIAKFVTCQRRRSPFITCRGAREAIALGLCPTFSRLKGFHWLICSRLLMI